MFTSNRLIVTFVAALVVLTACSGADDASTTATTVAGVPDRPDTTAPSDNPSAAVMAAAIQRLVTQDHTFGSGPPPFTEYLVQERIDPSAGGPTRATAAELRALTSEERSAIESVLAGLGPLRWIGDPDDWRTEELMPTIDGAVILGVGEPKITQGVALVPVSLWCGGLCGTWLTYRVEAIDGAWQVTGTEGPVSIS